MTMSCPWLPTVPAEQTDKQTLQIHDWIGIRTHLVKKYQKRKNVACHVTKIKITKIVSSVALIIAINLKQNFFWPTEEGFLKWHGITDKQTHRLTWQIVVFNKYLRSTFFFKEGGGLFSIENIKQIQKSVHPPHNWIWVWWAWKT